MRGHALLSAFTLYTEAPMLTGQEMIDLAYTRAFRKIESDLGFPLSRLPDVDQRLVKAGIEEGIRAAFGVTRDHVIPEILPTRWR